MFHATRVECTESRDFLVFFNQMIVLQKFEKLCFVNCFRVRRWAGEIFSDIINCDMNQVCFLTI